MYGPRARIGYACPPKVAEVFIYEFYKIAPAGVSLAISTVGGGRATREDLKESFRLSVAAAEELAKTGVDVLMLGGEPLNGSMGGELKEFVESLHQRFGIPVSTSLWASTKAAKALNARRMAVISPGPAGEGSGEADGVEIVATKGAGYQVPQYHTIPAEVPLRLAREALAEHPEIDTVKFPCAHWASLEAIETLEKEANVNATSSAQAIIWEALRQAKVTDSIPGAGRLLREF
jgi:maleate cis-trans isomerase